MIRKALTFAAVGSAVFAGIALSSAPACTTNQCDATTVSLGTDTGGTGFWIPDGCTDSTTSCSLHWYSSDTMNSGWTDFPGNATVTFTYPPLPPLPAGLTPDFADIEFWASVAAVAPTADASSFNVTVAAGQLVEFQQPWSSTSITVLNSSCQGYQLLLHVRVPVIAPDGGLPSEGGPPADAATQDRGDAGPDPDSPSGE